MSEKTAVINDVLERKAKEAPQQEDILDDKSSDILFNVENPMKFQDMISTSMMTSDDLHIVVNSIFGNVLAEYDGCIITPNQFGDMIATLYFINRTNSDTDFIKLISGVKNPNITKGGINNFINSWNKISKGKVYEPTQKFKKLFEPFIYTRGNTSRNVNVNNHIAEVPDPQSQKIYLSINNIDVLSVIRLACGVVDKDDISKTYDYKLDIIRPLNFNKYLIQVQRLDNQVLTKLSESIGITSNIGSSIPMNRNRTFNR